MPFPLLAAAIGAAGNLAGAYMNKQAPNTAAGVSRRAGNLASAASLKAGQMGAGASLKAATQLTQYDAATPLPASPRTGPN